LRSIRAAPIEPDQAHRRFHFSCDLLSKVRRPDAMLGHVMYIIARNITGPRLRCEALMIDKKTFTPWPPTNEDGWRRAYKFRDKLMAEVVRMEADPLGEQLKVIEAVYIP
jgi:hypothetical protein